MKPPAKVTLQTTLPEPPKRRGRKRTRPLIRPITVEELDLWAILSNTNGRKLAAASKSLDSQQRSGLRHFCALRRAVPLHRMQEAQEEIIAMERSTIFDDFHPTVQPATCEA